MAHLRRLDVSRFACPKAQRICVAELTETGQRLR
jgi:hypothetical protein